MLLDIKCTAGKCQIHENGTLQIVRKDIFGKQHVNWSVPVSTLLRMEQKPGGLLMKVLFISQVGNYSIDVSRPDFVKLQQVLAPMMAR